MSNSLTPEMERLSREFIKLGDMMANGLHHEPDGRWIAREYNKLYKALHPEEAKEASKLRNMETQLRVTRVIETQKCKCGGTFMQPKKHVLRVKCTECGTLYKLSRKK